MDGLALKRVACFISESVAVNLELSSTADSSFGLKRELVRKDGTTQTQFLHVDTQSRLYDFATSDPFEKKLLKHYKEMLENFSLDQIANRAVFSGAVIYDPLALIGDLENCVDEYQLIEQVSVIVRALGGSQFVYHFLRFDSARSAIDPVHASYLIGCRPGWIQQYMSNGWALDDPYLLYAARNIEPVLTTALNRDRVNHWFVQSARDYAFVRGLILPAHFSRKGLMGMLHVGCMGNAVENDEMLWKKRLSLQALSLAILSWQINKVRSDGMAKYDLDRKDVCFLQTYLIRRSAHDVAEVAGLAVNTVYQTVFRRLNKKMGTERIAMAAEKALAEGLLD